MNSSAWKNTLATHPYALQKYAKLFTQFEKSIGTTKKKSVTNDVAAKIKLYLSI